MTETTLLDIQSSYIFKLVFGAEKNKKLLISLINSILKGNPKVKDIELLDTDMSNILKRNISIPLSIKAEIDFQKFINIEIHIQNNIVIMDPAVRHLAEMLPLSSKKLSTEEKNTGNKSTYSLPKVIGIWIMGDDITDSEDAVNEATLSFSPTEKENYQIRTDNMRIFFVELQKFNPKHIDRKNMLNVWIAFLNNPLNTKILDITEVKQALETLLEVSADEITRETYYLIQQTELDLESAINIAVEEAVKNTQKEERAKAAKEKQELVEKIEAKKELVKKLRLKKLSQQKRC